MGKYVFAAVVPLFVVFTAASPTASAGPTYDCIDNGFGTINCHDTTNGGTYQESTVCSNSPAGGCITTWLETPGYMPDYG